MDVENKYGCLSTQVKLLELMKEFHAFAKANDIKYSLSYGSLLGAIRHKGFIPWDDDLDIMVDRNNYNKIIDKIAQNENLLVERDSPQTIWVDRVRRIKDKEETESGFIPTLDILVWDNVPESSLARKIKIFRILALQGMMKKNLTLSKGSFVMKVCSFCTFWFGKLFPAKMKSKMYREVSQIGDEKKTSYMANYNGEYADLRRVYDSRIFDEIVDVPFEDTSFSVVSDYHTCLTIQFGDYMTPPKMEDRNPRHGGSAD